MEFLLYLVGLIVNLDRHLAEIITLYGAWTYAILFIIVFCETGLVVTPILPGDSLLFAAGALAATTTLDVHVTVMLLIAAAVAGDTVNYSMGKYVGPRVFNRERSRFLNKDQLLRTHRFYERHGGKTIIIARFMPIIRTFAPFVAGIGTMDYPRFISYNVVGGAAWVLIFVYGGYFFGNIPVVKSNFALVIAGIVFVSILPGVIAYLKQRLARKPAAGAAD
jgi:membrane-associated protein